MRTSVAFGVLSLWVLPACRAVDPAPTDLDGQFHWFWNHGFVVDDADVHDAIDALRETTESAALEAVMRGAVSDLTAEEAEGFLPEGQLVEESAGFFLVNTFPCELEDLEPVLYELDQASQYLDIYVNYERTFTSDFDAYSARDVGILDWDIDLTASILGATYRELMAGSLRWVESDGERPSAIIQRTWLTEPAVFETGSKRFEQDYQLEVYVQIAPGTVLHAYAIWREIFLGAGFSSDDDVVVNTTLNNLEDWDDRTSELCLGQAR